MQTITYIKDYKGKKVGEREQVQNNEAFVLIDLGVAVREYQNKIISEDYGKLRTRHVGKRKNIPRNK
jgi:hypothetical protein